MSQRNKIVFAFYKSQGGTQRFDVGCTATSGNTVSCISPEAAYWLPHAAAIRRAGEVDVADTEPLPARGRTVARGADLQVQISAGERSVRHQHFNRTTSVRTVASSTAPQDYFNEIWNTIGNISYVTGSHNFKVGVNQAVGMVDA